LLAFGGVAGAGVYYWLDRGSRAPVPAPPAVKQKPAAAPAPPAMAAPAAAPPSTQAVAANPPAAAPVPPQAPSAPQLLRAEQLRRYAGYQAGPNKLLRERLAATRERLGSEPDGNYSVELFISENSDPARAERFLQRASDLVPLSEINIIPVASGTGYRLRVSYGVFASRQAAAEAARRLPPKYQNAFKVQLRTVAELRAAV
jgi:hypothetical protein